MGSGSAPKESYPLKKRTGRYLLAALVSAVTFAVYLPALRGGFLNWDDGNFIVDNHHIRSLSGKFFEWAFTDMSLDFWRPVTWISQAVDYAVWGLNPAGHHLTGIALHSVNTFLVVCLVMKLLDSYNAAFRSAPPGEGVAGGTVPAADGTTVLITAGVTGLLFGLHPLHVESVAWVSTRTDLLYSFFFLVSIMTYASYRPDKSARAYLLSLVFFALALMSKPMAVTLPLVLLLLDWYPFGRISTPKSMVPLLVEKVPFIALSVLVSVVTFRGQKALGAISTLKEVSLATRVTVAAKALILYLWKMVVPLHLLPVYPYPEHPSFTSPANLAALALVCAITAAGIALRKRRPIWLFAWSCYVITLLPVLGIIKARFVPMADRYTYLPSVAPFLLAGLGAAWVWGKTDSMRQSGLTVKRTAALAAAVLAGALSFLTVKQIAVWNNSVDLWSYVIAEEPGRVPAAYINRGLAFEAQGRFDPAIEDFGTAIGLEPGDAKIYTNRGIVFGETGRNDLAIEDFSKAIALDPTSAEAYTNRGLRFAEGGQLGRALEDFDAAIRARPWYADAYLNRGVTRERMGRFGPAVRDYDQAIALNPSDYLAYCNRGIVLGKMGRSEEAVASFTTSISLKPDFARPYLERGALYMKAGREELALRDFREACGLGSEEACSAREAYGKR